MEQGVVKKWFAERGFGFIHRDEGAGDVFVHVSQLANATELTPGQRVSFDIGQSDRGKGEVATNVRTIA